jgi:hypothetical protein
MFINLTPKYRAFSLKPPVHKIHGRKHLASAGCFVSLTSFPRAPLYNRRKVEHACWVYWGQPMGRQDRGEQGSYDDSYIVTGGSRPRCSVRQSASECIIVGGSAHHFRDPRLYADKPILELIRRAVGELFIPPENSAWCSDCGDWRPTSYFSKDSRNRSGCKSICHACDAARQRRLYAERVGRPVRPYRRQTA